MVVVVIVVVVVVERKNSSINQIKEQKLSLTTVITKAIRSKPIRKI